MADQIQSNYPLTQDKGQVGAISRPQQNYNAERVIIAATGAGMKPGQGYKLDGSGAVIPLVDLADFANAVGVLGFEFGNINTAVAGGENNLEGVLFAEGNHTPGITEGYMYVVAGEAVAPNAEIAFDVSDGKWYSTAAVNTNKSVRATSGASADGEIMEILVGSYLNIGAGQAVGAEFVIGVEAANVINLGVTLVDSAGNAITFVQNVEIFLSDSVAGLGIAATAPSGGWAIGTDGAIISDTVAGKSALVQSEATGLFDLDITEVGALTVYAVVVLPNGQQVVSGAITFAA